MHDVTTEFAPAEREPKEIIRKQAALFARSRLLECMDALPLPVVVVNGRRQIVYRNQPFTCLAWKETGTELLGLRPGEALGCAYSHLSEGGCGTTRFCRFCGAAKAILHGLSGEMGVEICRLVRMTEEGDSRDFQVITRPLDNRLGRFVLFSLLDVSHEARLRSLRYQFLKEVRNRAETINRLFTSLSREYGSELEGNLFAMGYAARRLMEEVESQAALFDAEEGLLGLELERFEVRIAVVDAVAAMEGIDPGRVIVEGCLGANVQADGLLLRYIITALLENGLEATAPGGKVTISCLREGRNTVVLFRNPGEMPEAIRLQLFRRGTSTKGPERGNGLAMARMLSRRYLDGDVQCVDGKEGEVVFLLRLPCGREAGMVPVP